MSGDLENLIEFRCTHCDKRLKAKAKLAGRRMRCPNCSTEIRVPEANNSTSPTAASRTGNSSTILNSSEGLSEASAIDNPNSTSSPPPKPVETPASNAPRENSFDVDDLQLESMAISDLDERHRASQEIRNEKDNKRRLENAAEKRRREEFQSRKKTEEEDDYNLLPASPPPATNYSMPSVPMLDEALLPKLAPEPVQKNSDPKASSTPKPKSNAAKSPTSSPSKKNENLDDLDSLVPDLEDVPISPSSGFFDEVVEDKYRIACPICGTIQYVGVKERGSTTKCGDCHTKYTVPPPPANWTPSKIAARHNNFDTDSPLSSDQDKQVVDRHRKQATSDLLEKAELDLEHEKSDEDRYGVEDFDTATFMRRTFGFLTDPVALGFIFGYALVFGLVFALVQYGVSNAENGEFGKGAALFCIIVGPLIGIVFGLPMISAALAQLEAVANRQSKVVDWPGFDMFDNLGDLICVAVALGMSAIPGFLIGLWLGGDGVGSGRIQLTGVMLSVLFLFPIFLLSILDSGSFIQLVTLDVLRSMREVYEAWASYYFKCFIFAAVTLVLWYLLLGKGKSAILGAIAGATFPVAIFFLFQQVGSLADLISEQLSFSFAKSTKEDDDKPQDLEDAV